MEVSNKELESKYFELLAKYSDLTKKYIEKL
jgi:hypothetical protein